MSAIGVITIGVVLAFLIVGGLGCLIGMIFEHVWYKVKTKHCRGCRYFGALGNGSQCINCWEGSNKEGLK